MNPDGWFRAAGCGDADALHELLRSSGTVLNRQDEGGWTALCHASFNGHLHAATLLIDAGADVRLNSPIHYAGQNQHEEICKLLVHAGAIEEAIPARPAAVKELWRAVYSFDRAQITRLANKRSVRKKNHEGASLLHVAAIHGDVDTASLLIELGADVNCSYGAGKTTPISEASSHGHVRVCELLLDSGADADLFAACMMGAAALVRVMLERDPSLVNEHRGGVSLLETVTEAGLTEIGRILVEHGAELGICAAASLGDLAAVVQFLKDDPNKVSAKRQLFAYEPLHCAAECGHPDVVQLLLDHGADVNARNEWGFTALHLAIIAARDHAPTERHHSVCKLLVDRGADLLATDDYGSTIIGLATGTVDHNSQHGLDLIVPKKTLALIESSLAEPGG